jgi:DMSO reductase anchor subunit
MVLILLYAVSLALIIVFRNDETKIMLTLGLASIIATASFDLNIAPIIIMTILFFAVENICVYYGLWKYNTKRPMPFTPAWLFFAWYLAIIFILKMQDVLQRNKIIFYMPCNRTK